MAEAVPLIDFFIEWLMKTYDVKSIDGKVKIAEEGVALIRKIPGKIRRNFYMKTLADKLDLQESLLYEMLRSSPEDRIRPGEKLQKPFVETSFPKSEEMVVRLMVHRPELIPTVSEEGILREFESPVLKGIALELEGLYQKKGRLDLAEALGSLKEDLKGKLCEYVFQESGLEEGHQEKILKDCIHKIRKRRLRKDEGELLKRIKEVERQSGEKGLEALLMERQEMVKRERSLQRG